MNKTEQLMRGVLFFILAVAMLISGWSLTTLGLAYGMPLWIAIFISAAIDGAGVMAGYRANTYAKSPYSGMGPKAITFGLVATSAWLNAKHALILGYGIPGAILFAAPAVILGFLLDMELKWTGKEELIKNGHVLDRLPIFGRLAWVLFPGRTFKGLKTVVRSRLDSAVSGFEKRQEVAQPKATKNDTAKAVEPKTTMPVASENDNTTDDKRHDTTKSATGDTTELDDILSELPKTTRLSDLVSVALENGFNDRDALQKAAERHLGEEVKRSTLNTCVQRWNKKNTGIGGYL